MSNRCNFIRTDQEQEDAYSTGFSDVLVTGFQYVGRDCTKPGKCTGKHAEFTVIKFAKKKEFTVIISYMYAISSEQC